MTASAVAPVAASTRESQFGTERACVGPHPEDHPRQNGRSRDCDHTFDDLIGRAVQTSDSRIDGNSDDQAQTRCAGRPLPHSPDFGLSTGLDQIRHKDGQDEGHFQSLAQRDQE